MENEKMVAINKRSIGVCILLSIITFGIYAIYWQYLLVKNVRAIKRDTTSCTGEMLCLIFVPFYSLFWWYTRGETVKQEFVKRNHNVSSNGTAFLVLSLFGFGIVAMAILQNDFNSLPSTTHSIQRSAAKTLKLVQLAVFCSIIILMGFTPLGFMKVGVIEITLIVIPVAIGAILLGPGGGTVLGAAFGVVSFIQCFGFSAFGSFLLGISPFNTFILCIVPRVLVGFLTGLIYKLLSGIIKRGGKTLSSIIAALACPVMNTALFIAALILLFGNNSSVLDVFSVTNAWAIYAVIALNAVVEAGVTLVVSAAVARVMIHFLKRAD